MEANGAFVRLLFLPINVMGRSDGSPDATTLQNSISAMFFFSALETVECACGGSLAIIPKYIL